ncbi:hypothetical protein [Novosphingobium clariflavum]|uniref:Lipoprotein n=1 Tax=Novosphingobium clariflavum TaxID=2029884 RepID=A0ABV6S9I2_9SPHN|nr:hypothetical protein [Novosphingobium clariflavum]
MRRASICVVLLVLVAACHREPSFDERYKAAQDSIGAKVKEIDAQASGSAPPPAEDAAAEGEGGR